MGFYRSKKNLEENFFASWLKITKWSPREDRAKRDPSHVCSSVARTNVGRNEFVNRWISKNRPKTVKEQLDHFFHSLYWRSFFQKSPPKLSKNNWTTFFTQLWTPKYFLHLTNFSTILVLLTNFGTLTELLTIWHFNEFLLTSLWHFGRVELREFRWFLEFPQFLEFLEFPI